MSNRTDYWSGIEQVITDRIELETMYDVVAYVRTCGPCAKVDVRATLNILEADNNERYITMGRFVVHFSTYHILVNFLCLSYVVM